MSQLMSYGEGSAQTIIFYDRTTGTGVTYLSGLGQTKCVASAGHSAQVFACQQNGGVVMVGMAVICVIVQVLPFAKVSQRFRS